MSEGLSLNKLSGVVAKLEHDGEIVIVNERKRGETFEINCVKYKYIITFLQDLTKDVIISSLNDPKLLEPKQCKIKDSGVSGSAMAIKDRIGPGLTFRIEINGANYNLGTISDIYKLENKAADAIYMDNYSRTINNAEHVSTYHTGQEFQIKRDGIIYDAKVMNIVPGITPEDPTIVVLLGPAGPGAGDATLIMEHYTTKALDKIIYTGASSVEENT